MAWKAQCAGHSENATLILEAVADQDSWIWHACFGMSGSCNDLNAIYCSPVFDNVLQGRAPPIYFMVNDHKNNMVYYLTDGIYPNWETFIQGITCPQLKMDKLFADKQVAARKDVECDFGVLQAKFAILQQTSLGFDEDILSDIMKTCIIIHNMIVEDERHNYTRAEVLRRYYEEDRSRSGPSVSAIVNNNEPFKFDVSRLPNVDFDTDIQRRIALCDSQTHFSLKDDLGEHTWQKYSPTNE